MSAGDGPAAPTAAWVADPSIAWRIVLTADLATPLGLHDARAQLARLHREQGWPGEGEVLTAPDVDALRRRLGDERAGVVTVGLAGSGHQVVVAAHHSRVDGLGLLAVLSAITGSSITSSARGVGPRPDGAGAVGTVVRRLTEVALAPPARIARPSPKESSGPSGPSDPLDVYVEADVPGEVRTADLVVAAAAGLRVHNARLSGGAARHRHVAVAIGVTRDATPAAGVPGSIVDRSALLRLRDVERLDATGVGAALREAPTQRAVQASGGGAGVMRWALRALAPRLGSTLLVSHLGRVEAPGVEALGFHPVTAGGTGVSLGAVTLAPTATGAATTRLTLRARGSDWTHDGLELLLEAVVVALGR